MIHRSDNHIDRATQAERPNAQDEAVDQLADAMCMVMNELADGNSVNDYVKAKARIAMQPFLLDDNGDLPDLEWAQAVVAKTGSRGPMPTDEHKREQRVRIMARYLYDRMPSAPRIPEDQSGVRMWGEVEGNEHYEFCRAVATSISLVDTRTHVDPD